MKDYLIQVAYTSEAMAALISNVQNREDAVRPVIEKLGGSLKTAYFALGDFDIVLIVSMPSDVEAGAIVMAFTAGGALKSVKATPLMSIADGMEAMKKAAGCGYQPVRAVSKAGV